MKKPLKRPLKKMLWALLILFVVFVLYLSYEFGYRGQFEPDTTSTVTSTDAVYDFDTFTSKLQSYEELYQSAIVGREDEIDNGTYIIPGLKSTRTLTSNTAKEPSICTSMTPQGIAVSRGYVFVSSYCHTKKHNSVIYVIDKNTHEFIKEMILPGKPHVGSIAYDTQHNNLWVCGSSNGAAQANAIAVETIERYSFEDGYQPIEYLHENNVLEIPKSSFMTYFNDHLYIGCFTTKENGIIEKYQVEDDGDILKVQFEYEGEAGETSVAQESAVISRTAQGAAFYWDKLFMSQSLGILPSKLVLFDNDLDVNNFEDDQAMDSFMFPSMMEQIYIDGDELYFIFESGAYAYQGLPIFSVDRILKVNIEELQTLVKDKYKTSND